ncbi:MAG: LytTR family DNA-binding domain-containing protein [Bacteroidota bacterium]
MLTSLIIDDEQRNRDTLERMLQNFCPQVQLLGKVDSVKAAIDFMDSQMPDVLFLDIEMPGGNGFTLLEHYENPTFEVIFTTAHDLYAINAIKFAALDYLLKPVNIRELQEAVKRAENKMAEKSGADNQKKYEALRSNLAQPDRKFTKIAMPTSEGIDFIEADDILIAQADRSYARFHLKSGKKVVVSKPLKEYEELLEQCNFFRIHKSHMVNLNHIEKYVKGKGGYVIMDDGSHVDVSVRRKEELLKVLTQMR